MNAHHDMSLAERQHYARTGTRFAPADPECPECRGAGMTTDHGYRGHSYQRQDVSGLCRCVVDATRRRMAG